MQNFDAFHQLYVCMKVGPVVSRITGSSTVWSISYQIHCWSFLRKGIHPDVSMSCHIRRAGAYKFWVDAFPTITNSFLISWTEARWPEINGDGSMRAVDPGKIGIMKCGIIRKECKYWSRVFSYAIWVTMTFWFPENITHMTIFARAAFYSLGVNDTDAKHYVPHSRIFISLCASVVWLSPVVLFWPNFTPVIFLLANYTTFAKWPRK